jgi:cystathionine gamma-synthase
VTERRSPQTIAAGNGMATDRAFSAVAPPLHLASSYAFSGFEKPGAYEYSRTRNPTRDLLADTLAKLDCGGGAIPVSSGMAAVDLVLSRLMPGDLILAPHDCYGGTYRLLTLRAEKGHFKVVFIDQADERALDAAIAKRPVMVLMETPSNPLMRVTDIEAVAGKARQVSATLAVDSTFLSPALQRPILLGADFVIHSATKYLNGHSDVVGGAVITAKAEDAAELAAWANLTGVTGSPFDCYQILRGIRTLFPRIERQQQTAGAIAAFLSTHAQVEAVHYPGLASHPGHEIARRQQSGFGAMLSFEIVGGIPAVQRFVEAVSVFTLAESLGGVESLVAHPATMTHVGMGAEARHAAGIKETLLRLSIGLEGEDDLFEDLAQALRAASQ